MIKIDLQLEGVKPRKDIVRRVTKVFHGLDKYVKSFDEGLKNARVRIAKRSRWGYKVIFELKLPGKRIFAEEKGKDLMIIVGKAKEQAERQIKKYMDKLRRH